MACSLSFSRSHSSILVQDREHESKTKWTKERNLLDNFSTVPHYNKGTQAQPDYCKNYNDNDGSFNNTKQYTLIMWTVRA